MKKLFKIIVLSALSLCLISCGKSKMNDAEPPIKEAESRTIIDGEFTVGIIDVIPDYCVDDITPTVALVSEFQSYPFTMYVGKEIGAQLEKGKAYVFRVAPVEVNYSIEELQKMNLSSLVWEISELEITEYRLAEENEVGLASLQLSFTESED